MRSETWRTLSREVSGNTPVSDYWDQHVKDWLSGKDPLDLKLTSWFAGYSGHNIGAVTRDGFVEPYQGDLVGQETQPRVVVLGLNPGKYFPQLQAREGLFADEIRKAGAYSVWVRDHPYDNETWLSLHPPNRYYLARLGFTRRWLQDVTAVYNDMLIFELYPWHSTGITAPIEPPAAVIEEFVLEPISEIDVRYVFAFGAPWARLASAVLKRPRVALLGHRGRDYGSSVPSRTVAVFELPSGQRLVAESHLGSAGPPSAEEVERLRDALLTLP